VEAAFDRWWAALPAGGQPEVDVATGWLVFHALVGAHPLPLERAWPVIEKSVREAGVRTSWRQPDERFESALRALTQQAIEDASPAEAVASLVAMTAEAADRAALAQLVAQLLAPGIPDLYQGGEGWDRSLVDPDNRRPVDPARRAGLLREARAAGPDDVQAAWARADRRATGLPRAIVVHTALAVRRRHEAAFAPGSGGSYRPLYAFGPDEARVLAFGRGAPVEVVAVSVRPAPSPVDASLLLPEGRWLDAFTGREHAGGAEVTALTDRFPVAVLERSGG
jgi:(1->4)-alpha-D-glucan 1-alpha-D-glucosylmutase